MGEYETAEPSSVWLPYLGASVPCVLAGLQVGAAVRVESCQCQEVQGEDPKALL